ncbi:hypothetical protein [Paenisporosarcina cavernae]|uniref:Uncharacterized protein n=1 Tax=Paenisporosarcina cavernae TaxID=2320858 RepID=A0A385YU21_9BACL|nr:hypothetical protein [Paenisporosarcina cavernae]AYC29062.1 hypothetical protein D3873_03915 [Paenisporosarcina cavernae]
MKKLLYLFASLALVLSVLSACSNGNTEDDKNENSSENVTKDTEKAPDEDTTDPESDEDADVRGPQRTLSYEVDGETKEENATLTESENQPYSVYLLDDFALTGEEPYKDTIYWKENDAIFMRVETISDAEADYEVVYDNVKGTAEAVAIAVEPKEIKDPERLPQGPGIERAAGFEVQMELGTVTSYIFMRDGLIIRTTIFDRDEFNLTEAFSAMAETIGAK